MKYFYNNLNNFLSGPAHTEHPPKVKYSKTVPKTVIKHIGDTAYDLYSRDTGSLEERVTSVKTIPAKRTRPHPPKWTINTGDPDLLIPIELSQARVDVNLNQDLRGDLSVMSPRESHQSEETLLKEPLGQFQAQRSDSAHHHK